NMAAEPLLQALLQLLVNAIEACGEKGIVTVRAAEVQLTAADASALLGRAQPGRSVEVRISDTGPGITPHVHEQLIQVPMVTNKPGHRGLGLGIVFRTVFAYGAGFALVPGPDRGTLARVCLPVV